MGSHTRKFSKKTTTQKVAWGFDLTEVRSDSDFLKILEKHGFKKVYSEKPSTVIYTDFEGKKQTHDYLFHGRFTEYKPTFQNKDGIRITVEHMGGKGSDKGFLGYIGINAPKKALPQLKKFLSDFRGKESVKGLDVMTKGGITTYVKEESPYESGFIGVK